jgi:hypothetical protein
VRLKHEISCVRKDAKKFANKVVAPLSSENGYFPVGTLQVGGGHESVEPVVVI